MCKTFRPARNFDPFSSFVWIAIALSGPLIHIFIKPEYSALFVVFTLAFGVGGYADGRLLALKIYDDRIAISRWGIDVWHSTFEYSYAVTEYPFSIDFHESVSGKLIKSIDLSSYTMESIDEIITALRVAGTLREI